MWPRRQQETPDAGGAPPSALPKRGASLGRPQGARPAPPRRVATASKWAPRRSVPIPEEIPEAPALAPTTTPDHEDDDAAWLLRAVDKKKEKKKAVNGAGILTVKQPAGVKRARSATTSTTLRKKSKAKSSAPSLSTQSWKQRQQQWSAGAKRSGAATTIADDRTRAEQQQQGFELVFQEVFGRQKPSLSTGSRPRGLVDSSEDDADGEVEQRRLALPPSTAAPPPPSTADDESNEEEGGEEADQDAAWSFSTSDTALMLDDFDSKPANTGANDPGTTTSSVAGRAAFARWKEEDASHSVGNNFVKLHMRKRFKGSSGKAKKRPAYLRPRGERLDDRTDDTAGALKPKLKDQQQLAGNGSGGFLNDGLDFIDECLQVLAKVERERAATDPDKTAEHTETKSETEELSPPRCHHAMECQLLAVKKKNKNHGREFFACPLGFDEGRCDFFLWQDNHVALALRQLFLPSSSTPSTSDEYVPLDLSKPIEDQAEALETNLKLVFGHARFRPGQQWAITRVLSRRNTLLVLPTGAGKSLCYQLPALFLPGITLVISPLVSLMNDQFERLPPALKQQAACLASSAASTGSKAAYAAFVRDLLAGRVRLVLLSPERALSRGMQKLLASIRSRLSLVCIDEAHCVSEWSHHFRPGYLRLASVFRHAQCVLAMTATASKRVANDVLHQLARHQQLRSKIPVTTKEREEMLLQLPWQRSNLQLRVRSVESDEQRTDQLIRFLTAQAAGGVIVYVHQQRQTEELARVLTERLPRVRVGYYHAKMDAEHKEKTRVGFLTGRLRVVVATIAFGMGIDKQNVRGVVHFHMPSSAENYLQQVGRAGRDGKPAQALLFLAPGDAKLFRSLAFSNALVCNQLRSLLKLILLAGEYQDDAEGPRGSHEYVVTVGGGDERWVTLDVQWAERTLDMKAASIETFLTLAAQRLSVTEDKGSQEQAEEYTGVKMSLLPTGAARCQVQLADKQLKALPTDSVMRRLIVAIDRGEAAHASIERQVNGYLSTTTASFQVCEMAMLLDTSSSSSNLTGYFTRLDTQDDTTARAQRRLLQQLRQAQLDGQVQRVTLEAAAFHVKLQFSSDTNAKTKLELVETLARDLFKQHELMERRQLARLARLYTALATAAVPASQCNQDEEEGEEGEKKARELELELTRYFHDEDAGMRAEEMEKSDLKRLGEVLEPLTAAMVEHVERDVQALVEVTKRDVDALEGDGGDEEKKDHKEDETLPWTSLSVARVFHGLGSPVFPVRQWRQHSLWRKYDSVAFEKLVKVADHVLTDGESA